MDMQLMEVVDRVMDALMEDPRTQYTKIEVANDRGILTLSGTVDYEYIRRAAEEIARHQEGVLTVINEIKME
jgi:osmotically-inducible protein OsmY